MFLYRYIRSGFGDEGLFVRSGNARAAQKNAEVYSFHLERAEEAFTCRSSSSGGARGIVGLDYKAPEMTCCLEKRKKAKLLLMPCQPAAGNLHLVLINCLHQLPPGIKVRALFETCVPFLDALGDIWHLLQLQEPGSSWTSRVRSLLLQHALVGAKIWSRAREREPVFALRLPPGQALVRVQPNFTECCVRLSSEFLFQSFNIIWFLPDRTSFFFKKTTWISVLIGSFSKHPLLSRWGLK